MKTKIQGRSEIIDIINDNYDYDYNRVQTNKIEHGTALTRISPAPICVKRVNTDLKKNGLKSEVGSSVWAQVWGLRSWNTVITKWI